MASFSAELRVDGHVLSVARFFYETTQATDQRGRVVEKVRYQPVQIVMNVPKGAVRELLLTWAMTHKRLAVDLVALNAATGQALETLSMAGAYCVGYGEDFIEGDVHTGAYQCRLTLTDPDGFTLHVGGPVSPQQAYQQNPFVAPKPLPPVQPPPTVLPEVAALVEKSLLERIGEGALRLLTGTAGMTAALLLTPTNSRDDPGYASEWEMYRRNHQGPPLTPDQLRLAQLERLHEQGDLTADEEAEMIALLASVRGIHIQRLDELNSSNKTPHQLLPGECRVGSFKALNRLRVKGDDITPHHIPSDAFMKKHGVSRNDGISIYMEQPATGGRHRKTKTYGGHMTPDQREAYYQMSPAEALKHDVDDARNVYREQGLLTPAVEDSLQEVIRQNKATFPHLFN